MSLPTRTRRQTPRVEHLESRDVPSLVPVGPEFRVNTYTSGTQTYSDIAMDADGDSVIVWMSADQDGSGFGIFAQRYDAGGVAVGSEFQVNNNSTAEQRFPRVAMNAEGSFVVVWELITTGSPREVFARRYNNSGVPQGIEFQVSPPSTGNQSHVDVAMDNTGNFGIVWTYNESIEFAQYHARLYTATGEPRGPSFALTGDIENFQGFSTIAMDSDGDFVVAYEATYLGYPHYEIYARRFSASGILESNTISVSNVGYAAGPSIGMDAAGHFVVGWHNSQHPEDMDGGLFARRYFADGTPQGSEVRINTNTVGGQTGRVTMKADGAFVAVWTNFDNSPVLEDVFAQEFSPAGSRLAPEFRVNTFTTNRQIGSKVAMSADGDVIVTWRSYGGQDGSGTGLYAQRYTMATTPQVLRAQVNNAAAQRSRVTDLTVTFSHQVTFAGPIANAFTLTRTGGGSVAFTATPSVINGVTVVTLNNFTGPETEFGSVRDGRYTLTALASQISANGQQMAANYTFNFHRFYGDVNGDARVDISDFGFFSLAYLTPANYNPALDFNNDGRIDIADFGQFSVRYFTTLP